MRLLDNDFDYTAAFGLSSAFLHFSASDDQSTFDAYTSVKQGSITMESHNELDDLKSFFRRFGKLSSESFKTKYNFFVSNVLKILKYIST